MWLKKWRDGDHGGRQRRVANKSARWGRRPSECRQKSDGSLSASVAGGANNGAICTHKTSKVDDEVHGCTGAAWDRMGCSARRVGSPLILCTVPSKWQTTLRISFRLFGW